MITAKNFLRVWFVLIFKEFTYTTSYEFKCPEPSQRIERSTWFCNTKQETYSCLLDLQLHAYTESCSCSFDFVRPGQKYVVSGYCKNMNCSAERYQPFKFYSSELSQCAFTKSLCSDEGQLKVNIGSTREDDACRCDSTKGYTFVLRPTNNRFCTPQQEDCSCYVPTCPTNNTFSNDFDCRHDFIFTSVSFDKTQFTETEVVKIEYFDDYKYNLGRPTKKYRIIAAIGVKALFLIALALNCMFYVHSRSSSKDISTVKSIEHQVSRIAESDHEDKNTVNVDTNCIKDGDEQYVDTITTRDGISRVIDKLEKIHVEKWGNQEDSVYQIIKLKYYECDKVLNFLMLVLNSFQKDGPIDEINIVEGIRLIKIIADTHDCINEQLVDCIKIPAEFLKQICLIREKKIVDDDRLPPDVSAWIENIKKNFKELDNELNRKRNHQYYFDIINKIAEYVETLQREINNLIQRQVICPEEHVDRVKHKSKHLINVYMDVQFMTSAYCIRFFCGDASCSGEKSVFSIKELVNIQDTQRNFLRVFCQPKYENVAFFALFNPSEYEFITEYLKEYDVTLQNLKTELDEKEFAIKSKKWPQDWIVMSSNPVGTIWTTKSPDDKPSSLFRFKSISGLDNTFLITSVKWPSWFVYMKQAASVKGQDSKKGLKREWKVVRLEDGRFMMCSQKWPCKFVYTKNAALGEMVAAYEYPKDSGFWNLIHKNEFEL